MAIETDWEVIDTSYGPMRMYTARPDGGSAGPGVLVVSESFGVTEHVEEVCRRFANEGIVALAPDLYHRFSPRGLLYDDAAAASARRKELSDNEVFDDLSAALRFLGARGEVRSGLVGALAFGDGARDAFLLAAQNPDVLALIAYDGPSGSELEDAAIDLAEVTAPVVLFYGQGDHAIPADEVEQIRDALDRVSADYNIVTYPDAGFGFFCEARPQAYDADASGDSWTRTVDFIYERLEG